MSSSATRTEQTGARWLVLALALMIASTVQPAAQVQDRAAAFTRLTQKALAEGTVPVIVRLAVPGLGELTAASVAVPSQDAGGMQAERRQAADAGLRRAIDESADRVIRALPRESYTVNNRYASVPFLALRVSADALATLHASPLVAGIEEDALVELIAPEAVSPTVDAAEVPQLDGTVNIVGAATAWSWGFTGTGWYVAILDTGIRSSHQFFFGKTIVEACFSKGPDATAGAGDCPNGQSTQTGAGSAAHHPSSYSGWDHGTHVAGIAAGSAGPIGGIARGASLIALQVFSRLPASSCSSGVPCVSSWNSDSLAALDWIYTNRGTYRVASANMSLGGGLYTSPCDSDARRTAIDNLRNAGIATAIAAGNDGACGRISAPGCISSSVAVASSTDADNQSSFSNWHSSMVRLFAPGSSVYSATGASDTSYASWNGTSMATPHVAGAWALMKQVVSNGSVTDFLNALRNTGVSLTSVCDGRQTGIPRFRVDRAIATLVRYQLTLQASQFGTTDPPPGVHYYAPGTQVEIKPLPETYAAFVGWSGAASGSADPLTLLMDSDKTLRANFQFIYRPNAEGVQALNRSVSQGEYINVIRWGSNAANQGINITRYRVYRWAGASRELVIEAPASQSEYLHRKQPQGPADYEVVAVTHDNREGEPNRFSVRIQ